jgi:anthranilate phosphoribosyltransferase
VTPDDAVDLVLDEGRLDEAQARTLFDGVFDGLVAPARLRDLLRALHRRGETADELVGAARVLRARALPVGGVPSDAVDTCGTGGDGAGTFNISTAAALVVAGAGVPVAKHGNRAASGGVGSADVLEALGVKLELPPARVVECIHAVGIVYLHAPAHHPAMKQVAPIRRELGIRTIFNLLGPLVNPAGIKRQVIGVPKEKWLSPMAEAVRRLGAEHAWVVCGDDRFDELALCGPSAVAAVRGGRVERFEVRPESLGMTAAPLEALVVSSVTESAERILAILSGERGPARDVVCLNAAAALVVAGVSPDLGSGLERAAASIEQGHAARVLERLRAFTAAAVEARA